MLVLKLLFTVGAHFAIVHAIRICRKEGFEVCNGSSGDASSHCSLAIDNTAATYP